MAFEKNWRFVWAMWAESFDYIHKNFWRPELKVLITNLLFVYILLALYLDGQDIAAANKFNANPVSVTWSFLRLEEVFFTLL